MKKIIIALSLGLAGHVSAVNAEEYVVVTSETTRITLEASTESLLIGEASEGMIFELIETKDSWYEVALPSGEYRYFPASQGTVVAGAPELTDSETVLINTCKEIIAAERQANEEATKLESDIFKQIDLTRVLSDRYKLVILEKYGISPVRNTTLSVWCATN